MEIAFDFRKQPCDHAQISVNDEIVEQLHHYEYLCTIIDFKLNFKDQVDSMRSKACQRLYFYVN